MISYDAECKLKLQIFLLIENHRRRVLLIYYLLSAYLYNIKSKLYGTIFTVNKFLY